MSDSCSFCSIFNDGVLILCLPECDPLLQDCGEGQYCAASGENFLCFVDVGQQGWILEGCEF